MVDDSISRREFPGRLALWAVGLATVAKGVDAYAGKTLYLGYEVLQAEEERGYYYLHSRDKLSLLVRKARRKYGRGKQKGYTQKVGAAMDTLDSYFYVSADQGCARIPRTNLSVKTFGHSLESAVPTETGMLFAAYTLLEALQVIPKIYKIGCRGEESEFVMFKENWGDLKRGGTRVFVMPYRPAVVQIENDLCGDTALASELVPRSQIIALVDNYLPQKG